MLCLPPCRGAPRSVTREESADVEFWEVSALTRVVRSSGRDNYVLAIPIATCDPLNAMSLSTDTLLISRTGRF